MRILENELFSIAQEITDCQSFSVLDHSVRYNKFSLGVATYCDGIQESINYPYHVGNDTKDAHSLHPM